MVYVPAGFTDTLIYGEDIEAVVAALTTARGPTVKNSKPTKSNFMICLDDNICIIIPDTPLLTKDSPHGE
jgi:hypothetical protein